MPAKVPQTEAKKVFEILAREHQAMLMTYLRAVVRDQNVIDDLFQDTMLIAWKKLSEYDHSCPFGPWLRGIAAKLILAHYRKAKSNMILLESQNLEYLSQHVQYVSERPGDTWEEKTTALKHCIDILADPYRQAIRLRYFEAQSASQIAAVSKTTLENTKKRLQRARIQLLECLKHKKVVMETTT